MDCMMACLAECTELWPDAALEPRGDDSKDDGDGECNPHRDPWRERRPVEAWQAEQVTDGGHENKPPCSALPAPSSKDTSGQRERCGSATGQDTSERFDVSPTSTARQQKQQPSPGSVGSKSCEEVPDHCGQQEPSPAFAAAAERAAAAALRAARAMAHAEEAAHVAREAESSADRAVKAATSAAHRITPRQAQAASSPQGLQLQLEEPQQHQQHQQQLQLEQQQLQLEKQKQQLEEQKKHLQHQQRLLEQEELEQQQLYLTEGEDDEEDEEEEDEEEEEVRGRLDSAAGLSTSDFQQQQQQSQSHLHRFDVTPIKQGGGSSTRLRAVEVEHASAWTTATTRSGSLTSKATPLTTPLTSASASGAGAAEGGGGGGGFSSSSMSAPPPGSPLDFHHDAMSTTDHQYHREHRDNSANSHHHQQQQHHHHHHHHPHQHQHHHDHYRSERGERVRSTALTSTCTNRGSIGGIDSDGVSDLSDSDLSAIMTASLMGQITPKDDCSLSGDATPRGRGGGGGGGSSSGGWATYSVEEVLRGSGAGGGASDAWVAAAAAATPSQVGSIGSGSVGRTRDGGSASAAWPGPMYRRAASMGTEWLKLDQPEDTSTSKHKSLPRRYARLANPDSEPERAREDSGVGGLGGGGGSSGSSRLGRGWNVDPGGSLERKGVPPTPSKALVTTHLRHLRLSPDGAVMMVQPNDGQAEYEFVLADLIEVRENIPQETVTLIGRQVKIRIAFEGQTVALKQFSAMLAPAWKPRTSTVDSVEPAATEWDSRRDNEVEQAADADEEEGPISHPERLVRSSEPIQTSRSAPSSRTTMTRASAMWQAADVRSGTTSIGWESLMISPVVSIQSGGGWEPVGAISKKLSLPALFDSFSGSQFDSPAPSAVGVQAMSATASDYYEAGGRSPISMLVSSQQHHHQQQQQQQQEMKSSRRSSRAPLARRRHREPEDALREGMTLTLPSLMDAGEPPEVAMPSFNGIAKTQQLRSATDHALDEPYISSSRSWRTNDEMDRRGESSGELRSAA